MTAVPGNEKANERKPESCLGPVFNFKLGCFCNDGIGTGPIKKVNI